MSAPGLSVNRRDFLRTGAAVGGGLLISLYLPELARAAEKFSGSVTPPPEFAPNAFIRIGADDIVKVVVNKSEMGQGPYTSLPMIVAEELEADWSKVRLNRRLSISVHHPVFGI